MHEVIGVNFNTNRLYYFDPAKKDFKAGDSVIVETEKGMQYATVVVANKEMPKKNLFLPLKKVVRLSTDEDDKQHANNLKDSEQALERAKKLVKELDLDMRIYDCAYTFDRNQLLFTFVADERIDFRELAKKLAYIYKTRIELKQIGIRDKAKEVGGIGPCGRFLCCNTFLLEFETVSINMAKNQNLSLNPTKINGLCGRLLCCLNYENEQYAEMKKTMPKLGSTVTVDGKKGKVIELNLFEQSYVVEKEDKTTVIKSVSNESS